MAILNKEKQYLKLDVGQSFVDQNGLHIAYDLYFSEKHRAEYKEQQEKIEKFFCLADNLVLRLYQDFLCEAEKAGANESTTQQFLQEDGTVKSAYPLLFEKQRLHNSLYRDIYFIRNHLYHADTTDVRLENLQTLKSIGLSLAWLDQPLIQPSKITVLAKNIDITFMPEALYRELKLLTQDPMDC